MAPRAPAEVTTSVMDADTTVARLGAVRPQPVSVRVWATGEA
jgi:hypothetical protein